MRKPVLKKEALVDLTPADLLNVVGGDDTFGCPTGESHTCPLTFKCITSINITSGSDAAGR